MAFVVSDSFAFGTSWLDHSDVDDNEDEFKVSTTCVSSGDILSGSTKMN